MTTNRSPSQQIQPYKNLDITVNELCEEKNDYKFVTLLDRRDDKGNSYLSYLYIQQGDEFNKLLKRISEIKSKIDKEAICKTALNFRHNKGQTLFHDVITHYAADGISMVIRAFGQEAWIQALNFKDEVNHNTMAHCAILSDKDIVKKLWYIYEGLNASEINKKGTKAELLKIIFTDNGQGCNIFHYLSKSNLDAEIINKLCSSIDGKLLKKSLNTYSALEPNRPLEIACRFHRNDILMVYLNALDKQIDSPTIKSQMMQRKNFHKNTLIHYVCRYGDHRVIQKTLELLGADGLCHLQLSQLKHPNHLHESLTGSITLNINERIRIAKKQRKSTENIGNVMNTYNEIMLKQPDYLLVNTFTYLVERGQQNKNSDYQTRLNDFIDCLGSIISCSSLPKMPGSINQLFQSHRYYHLRKHFAKANIQIDHLKTFIRTISNNKLPRDAQALTEYILKKVPYFKDYVENNEKQTVDKNPKKSSLNAFFSPTQSLTIPPVYSSEIKLDNTKKNIV